MISNARKPEVYAIVSPDGIIGWHGHTKYAAWSRFFTENSYRVPLDEAIKAYEAIGYRCKHFKLVEIPENDEKNFSDSAYVPE